MTNLIFDAHLDLSMNAMEWNRNLTQPVSAIRAREKGQTDKPDRGRNTVSLPEMRKGKVGVCVATMIARYVAPGNPLQGWHSQEQAWAQTQAQLAWYRTMEDKGEMVCIRNASQLENHIALWNNSDVQNSLPIGFILSLEGADSIIDLRYLHKQYEEGLRAVGPAHFGEGIYAYGTDTSEGRGLTHKGIELLKEMEKLNIILDTTHLCDKSFWEALEHFHGHIWASHNNCRIIVPGNRQFTDDQINELIRRDAVIGTAFDAWMLVSGWQRGISKPDTSGVSLNQVIDHIDHVCQLAGNSLHAAIGSDLDGGFGKEQCPVELDTIADLQKLTNLLGDRGYHREDIENIMYKNWVRFLNKALPGH